MQGRRARGRSGALPPPARRESGCQFPSTARRVRETCARMSWQRGAARAATLPSDSRPCSLSPDQ
eukprot:4655432-Alexandrium_andersonii.AAC.1